MMGTGEMALYLHPLSSSKGAIMEIFPQNLDLTVLNRQLAYILHQLCSTVLSVS